MVIATRQTTEEVSARIADVLKAEFPSHLMEVVVAVDRSATSLASLRRAKWPGNVRLVVGTEAGGKAAALNAGVAASTGDILVFADTAQRFEPSAIAALAQSFADPRVGIASGSLRVARAHGGHDLGAWYWRYERWLRANESKVHSSAGVTGAIYAMRRLLWQPLPPGLILDDLYTPMQVVMRGYRVGFIEDAVAYDPRTLSPAVEYRRKARTLTGVIQLCVWLPSVLSPFHNPIWAQFVFHKVLRLITPLLVVAGALALVVGALRAGVVAAFGPWLLVAAALLVALLAVRRIRSAVIWGAATQGAVVRALVNGMRGRWDVWSS